MRLQEIIFLLQEKQLILSLLLDQILAMMPQLESYFNQISLW